VLQDIGKYYYVKRTRLELFDPARDLDVSLQYLLAVCTGAGGVLVIDLDTDDAAAPLPQNLSQVAVGAAHVEYESIVTN